MKVSQLGQMLLLTTGFPFLILQPLQVKASNLPLSALNPTENPTAASAVTTVLPRLRDVPRPATTVDQWLAQIEDLEKATLIQVTGVRIDRTETGLDIILDTANAQPLSIDATQFTTEDKALVANIPNAVLALPAGNEFQADKPTDDIARVSVVQVNPTQLRVTVVGRNTLPTSEVTLRTGVLAYSLNPDLEEEEELVVTGTRTEERLPNVPRSITVIPREQIAEQSTLNRNLADTLGKLVPGFAPPSQSISLFGQSLRGRSVIVLIDGIPQSTSRNVFRDLQTIDPNQIERIEVLRGPTAIYGDGATGGVINVITRKPTIGFTAQTDLGLDTALSNLDGSQGYRLQQSFSGTQGKFDYYIGAGLAKTGGLFDAQGDRIPPDPNGQGGIADTTQYNVLAKAGFNFTADQRLQFTVSYLNENQFTDFTSDPIVARLPGRQKARALRGLSLEDPQGSQNLLLNLDYTHQNLFNSRVHAQLYYRDYKTRFFSL
ncbi:MAG: TonB-dependent receptor plug domain-containing protein [Stenomitos frigidus ULC029]